MATIYDADLENLLHSLEGLDADFANFNSEVFAVLGGADSNLPVGSIQMQASRDLQNEVADCLRSISKRLAWLTDVCNALFSVNFIVLERESPERLDEITPPPNNGTKPDEE